MESLDICIPNSLRILNFELSWTNNPPVSDNKIITANGTATMEFAKEVLCTLKVTSEEKIMEWYNFHKLGYYNAPTPKM